MTPPPAEPKSAVADGMPKFVVTSQGELLGEDTPENRELSRRVRACVNACAGISTEELEQGIVADMCRVLNDVVPVLERQNAARRSA
jgi:hypothetical protein